MQIKIEALSKVKKRINFEIPAARVASEIEKVYGEIRKHASIKGFRKGKVPQAVIEKNFSDKMEADVLKNLVNDTYFKALMEEKIFPVSHPVIETEDLKKGESFKYSATVEVVPEIVVKDFAGLEVKKERYVQDEEIVNQRLKEMQESMAQLKPVEEERPTVAGDFVTLDFTGFVDGVPFKNGDATDYLLELGAGKFIPGFEEQIVGMKAGEEGNIKVTFPENYGNMELSGKDATFAVMIKEIKVKELPPLDDDFAKEFGEFDTFDQLKAKLTEMHENQEKERIENDCRERLVKALIEKNDIEIPDALVEKQLQLMLDNAKNRLSYQKLTLEMMGMDDEKYKSQFKDVAETKVKGSLLLDALSRQEKIGVEDGDIEEEIKKIAELNNQERGVVKDYFERNREAKENLIAQLREDNVIKYLISKAHVIEVSRDEIKEIK